MPRFGRNRGWDITNEFTLELAVEDPQSPVYDLTYDMEVPELQPFAETIYDAQVPSGAMGSAEFVISFRSKGYHAPATWENPAEGSDERSYESAHLRFQEAGARQLPYYKQPKIISVPDEIGRALFEKYYDKISEQELEGDAETGPDPDPDYERKSRLDRQFESITDIANIITEDPDIFV